jgi:dolichol-phosphate mannosyltransferase
MLNQAQPTGQHMSLEQNLLQMEHTRELYWLRYPSTSPTRLRWRALTVRHCFHVLPGESILELGAGSGIWTEHLASVLRGENPITAAVFNEELFKLGTKRALPNTRFVLTRNLLEDYPAESFDYVVGTAILCHNLYSQNLHAIHKLLKPGGRFLFFEANYWNPQVFLKSIITPFGRWMGNADCQIGMRKYKLLRIASHQGFTQVDITPYDIIHPATPSWLVGTLQALGWVLEHTPIIRELCGTLYIWGQKPGNEDTRRPRVNLAHYPELFDSISIVVPCHNEEMNIAPLVDALKQMYANYIHEIIIVNDNSTDRTDEVARALARADQQVKVLARKPPNGVGRALRDGYAAASGHYILTMDCDFVQIVPELRDLFEVAAAGHDGAIGSRFSHESVLINYPFLKIICNRGFHLLVRLFLHQVHDISNNLKLYRADILKTLQIDEPHFAANAETGLKPILAGYDIKEVPVSWINRTTDMGNSSFRIVKVAPNYALALFRILWNVWRSRGVSQYRLSLRCRERTSVADLEPRE